jgi:hypothetical protein
LNDSSLRERLEQCLVHLKAVAPPDSQPEQHSTPTSFQQKVHEWNPKLPIWNRSSKE